MSDAVLRIGTWNVEYADNFATNDSRREVMQRCPADIWVLTETHDALTPSDSFAAVHSAPRPPYGLRVKPGARWVSIWTRLPIITRVVLDDSDQERTTIALIDTPLGPLGVYGTVMPWHSDRGRMGERADATDWSEHHRVLPQQIEEWRKLQRLLPGAQICVAGDYNTDMRTGAHYGTRTGIALLRQGLKDVGLFCATNETPVCGGWLFNPPIDHIALPLEWQPRVALAAAWEGKVGQPRLSDHSGVVVAISA
jgi:hypothetical protein